mgnify:FL=1
MNKRYIIPLLLAFMAHFTVMAVPYCDIRKFSITDGLAANTISDIKQSPDKLMWFATWNGLSYYDGYSFHTFRDEADDVDVLSTNRIISIYPTLRNNIWCVTADSKLYLYNTHLCKFVNRGKEINEQFGIDLRVDKIYPLKTGNTWITAKSANYLIRNYMLPDQSFEKEIIKVGQHGLRSGNVWHVWADKKGREWILTDKGATIYNHHFSTQLPFKWIREVGNNIFLATPNGKLAVYDEKEHLVMIPMPAGVTRINQLKNTGYQLLIATNIGLVVYNPRTFKTEVINVQSPSQPMAEVKNIYTDAYGMVWVFTDGMGVTMMNPRTGQKAWLYADQPDPAERTTSEKFFITQDENKTLWVVPNGGTFSYFDRKAGKLVPYLLHSNSSGNFRVPNIKHFCLSDQGILWISGMHDLTQVAFKNHRYHLTQLDEGEAQAFAICNTPEGYHWTGYYNGMIKITNSRFEKVGYLAPSGQVVPQQVAFCPSAIFSIFYDTEGKIWIGTREHGIFIRTKEGMTQYVHNPADKYSLPHNKVYDIVADRHGRIWVGTYGGGLSLVQMSTTGKLNFISRQNILPWPKKEFSKVRRIFCTPTGEILAGTTDGMITFSDNVSNPAKIKFYTTTHVDGDTTRLAASDVNFIMQHSNGKTYVSQMGGVLQNVISKNLLQDSLQFLYNKKISSDEGTVQSMVEDNAGNIWVVRESSIDKYNLKTKNLVVFGPNDFDFNMSFTEARPAHDPATDDITVGTPTGSLTFNPAKMQKSPYQARIIFTSLHYMGEDGTEPILHKDKVVIPANKRNLTISFAALDFSRKYNQKYRYRLDGFTPEGQWIELGKSNYIGFNRISSGNYVLKVMGTNSHGIWSKYVAELPIEVRPTFWESIWGKMMMVFLLMCVVGSIFYIYNRNQHEKISHEMSLMKNDFFSDASHKLRTPLTLIGGPLKEVLDTEHGITRKGREMLTIALKNSYEMLDMLNKILRYDNSTLTNYEGMPKNPEGTLVNTGGIDKMDSTENEEDEIPGQISDENVARYLAEAEKAEKELEENMTEEEKVAREEQRKEHTVLVVEDNKDLRKYLYTILSEHYNVLLAENGKAGLLMTRTEMPDFIITDVTMPVMDGITMVREIKADHDLSQIPIIILSAKASVQDRLKGFEMGVDAYMTKPFSTEYLLGRISAVLKQRHNLQKEMIQKLEHTGNLIGKAMSGDISSGINGSKNKGLNNGLNNALNNGLNDALNNGLNNALNNGLNNALNNGLNNALNDGQNGGLIASSANEPEKTLSQITQEITEKEREKEEKARLKREQSDFAFMASQINDATTARILKYVTEHIDTPDLKIDDIADAMGMSRSVLYTKIKQQLGMTPIDFVRHVRIMRACELLKDTDESLSSVAFAVGFSDPKYFSKVFKRETGIVPTEYRERTR